jgi:hypothetical protein
MKWLLNLLPKIACLKTRTRALWKKKTSSYPRERIEANLALRRARARVEAINVIS